jgi:hypothetical protein
MLIGSSQMLGNRKTSIQRYLTTDEYVRFERNFVPRLVEILLFLLQMRNGARLAKRCGSDAFTLLSW